MVSRRLFAPLRCSLLMTLLFCASGNAADTKRDLPGYKRLRGDYSYIHRELPSADDLLSKAEFKLFRPGRAMDEILKEIHWRGDLEESAAHQAHDVKVIRFTMFKDDPESNEGSFVRAVFVDNKFHKFVDISSAPLTSIVEFPDITRAMESPSVSLVDVQRAHDQVPSSVDPGLTAATLFLTPFLYGALEREAKKAPSEDVYKENRRLRDQFNASRLSLGMTQMEVEAVLGVAKPLESGKVAGSDYCIYGDAASFKITDYLHYSNVLVLFHEGKAVGIRSCPGGNEGLHKMRKWCTDLPPVDE